MRGTTAVSWRRTVFALLLFGTAFGYLEAAVVSYLRALHEPARLQFHPGRSPDDLFPLLTLEQLKASGALQQKTLVTEVGREAATLVMLAGIALAASENAGQWAAAFAIAFGTWDITFYVFLKVLLGWPASLFTWDILFLLPVPWVGPVLAPALVSAAMIAAGVWHLRLEARGAPIRIRAGEWAGMLAGATVIIVAFAEDYAHIMRGGMPHPFDWGLFGMGMAIGVASYGWSVRRSLRAEAGVMGSSGELPGSICVGFGAKSEDNWPQMDADKTKFLSVCICVHLWLDHF